MENEIIDFVLPKLNILNDVLFYPIIKETTIHFNFNKKEGKDKVINAIKTASKMGYIVLSGNLAISGKLTREGNEIIKQGGYLKHLSNNGNTPPLPQYNFNGNVGQFIQDSRFSNSPNTISVNDIPAKNENKSIWLKIWNLCTENKLIAGLMLACILSGLAALGIKILK